MSRPLSPAHRPAALRRDTVEHNCGADLSVGEVEIVSDFRCRCDLLNEIGDVARGVSRTFDHRLASEHLGPGLDVIVARGLQLTERP